jgi:hypothetical protein
VEKVPRLGNVPDLPAMFSNPFGNGRDTNAGVSLFRTAARMLQPLSVLIMYDVEKHSATIFSRSFERTILFFLTLIAAGSRLQNILKPLFILFP